MGILSGLAPQQVFRYFEELCAIPHGSGGTKAISDHLVVFAKEHGLGYRQDASHNVVIFKKGTPGYENAAPVILQGHMDMVCEKEKDCAIDFKKDGLRLGIKDGYVYAEGTTLGGDDGIAIAYALAILDAKDIAHPPIEAVFTVDEEIGMLGAAAFDAGCLQGKIMLNIDSEEEGYLLVSCAGGVTATCHLPVAEATWSETSFKQRICLKVTGLTGGHSGTEIDKGRANANQVLGRILYAVGKEVAFRIADLGGGLKDNAIPREAYAVLCVENDEDVKRISDIVRRYETVLQKEYHGIEETLRLEMDRENGKELPDWVFDGETTKKVITALVNLPGGIVKMSRAIKGLVQTSLNLGILKTERKQELTGEQQQAGKQEENRQQGEVMFSYSVRSSVQSEKEELVARLECLLECLGGYVICQGDYPAWEYREDSPLREIMIDTYRELYGEEPVIQAIHAGVECGLFAGKIRGLDCVSFGPNILDIHTPRERLEIASVERVWRYLLRVLEKMR